MNRGAGLPADEFAQVAIDEQSAVAAARRLAAALASDIGFGDTDAGRVALVVTEAATNIVKHAGHGEILVRAMPGPAPCVEVLAIDSGPGLDPAWSARDGFSTAGTLGMGLGSMRRVSSSFGVYAPPGRGTVARMLVAPAGRPVAEQAGAYEVGVVSVPHTGETVNGDDWAVHADGADAFFMVADGLGHGPQAREAARAAVAAMPAPGGSPARALERIHAALRATRGAAVAVAGTGPAARIAYAGIGNVSGVVVGESQRHLLSHSGIVGHNARRFAENDYDWPDEALLVMHSDGLGTHWDLADYPGLAEQHPAIVAAVLYRDHSRRRDDVTVLAARRAAAGSAA